MTAKGVKSGTRERGEYVASRTRDYTRYTSLLGESLAAKVDLLAQVLGSVHEPSLGRYKERLLAEAIASFVPRRYEVTTGFVLFPRARRFAAGPPPYFNYLNSSDFVPSRQCDIIVFDASHYPPVFRDGDFAVLRPESVRAVVEVKGSLSPKSLRESTTHMIDFGAKWRACSLFYREIHAEKLQKPFLAVMAWRVAIDGTGRQRTNGRLVREHLASAYARVPRAQVRGLPVLDSLLVHSEFEVSATTFAGQNDDWSFGFLTHRGRAIRFDESGTPELAGDNTVSSLLAGIHANLETPYNRLFSRSDQSNSAAPFGHSDHGYTPWLTGDDSGLPYSEPDS